MNASAEGLRRCRHRFVIGPIPANADRVERRGAARRNGDEASTTSRLDPPHFFCSRRSALSYTTYETPAEDRDVPGVPAVRLPAPNGDDSASSRAREAC